MKSLASKFREFSETSKYV